MDFTKNPPSIKMTVVGFGQAGTRIADRFAEYKDTDGLPVYNTLALNSNDGDLSELRYVPKENRVSLKLGGLGKDPEKGVRVLEENGNAKNILLDFVTTKINPEDELTLFIAGLGGGTGTATIVKAIEEFHEFHNMKLLKEALITIRQQVGDADFRQNIKKHQTAAFKAVRDKFKKVGVIVTVPTRSDGPDVLRQVNAFASKIWEMTKNPTKGIAFTIFADNQMFYDRFQKLIGVGKAHYNNYRDFANSEIASIFHEINTATNGGGTSVTFDSNDFRRVIMEHSGCLILNRVEENFKNITNNSDLKKLFLQSLNSNNFHDPIQLEGQTEQGEQIYTKVFHVGLLGVIPPDLKALGSSFIDDAKNEISERLPLQGTIFSGYLNENNNYKATLYTFYKADALPTRLSKGLVAEYNEFMEKQRKISYKSEGIEQIAAAEEEYEFDSDILTDLGIDISEPKRENESSTQDDIDIEDMDFSDIDPDTI